MLQEQINKDYIQSMKDRNALKSAVLNFLRAALKNIIIEKRVDNLEDAEVIAVIKKQVKQRQDSIEQYAKGNREDLVEKETKELEILKEYLPQEMSEDELAPIIQEVVGELQANSMKDMGRVMKVVLEKTAGRADNAQVSQLVKKTLQEQS